MKAYKLLSYLGLIALLAISCKPKKEELRYQPPTLPAETRTRIKPVEIQYPPHQDGIIYGFTRLTGGVDSVWTFPITKGMNINSLGVEIMPDSRFEEIIRIEPKFKSDMYPDSPIREVVEIAFSTEADFDKVIEYYRTRIGDPEEGSSKENGIAFFSWGHPAGDDFIHIFYSDRTTIYGGRNTLQILRSIPIPNK